MQRNLQARFSVVGPTSDKPLQNHPNEVCTPSLPTQGPVGAGKPVPARVRRVPDLPSNPRAPQRLTNALSARHPSPSHERLHVLHGCPSLDAWGAYVPATVPALATSRLAARAATARASPTPRRAGSRAASSRGFALRSPSSRARLRRRRASRRRRGSGPGVPPRPSRPRRSTRRTPIRRRLRLRLLLLRPSTTTAPPPTRRTKSSSSPTRCASRWSGA